MNNMLIIKNKTKNEDLNANVNVKKSDKKKNCKRRYSEFDWLSSFQLNENVNVNKKKLPDEDSINQAIIYFQNKHDALQNILINDSFFAYKSNYIAKLKNVSNKIPSVWDKSLTSISKKYGNVVSTIFSYFKIAFLINLLYALVIFTFIVVPEILKRKNVLYEETIIYDKCDINTFSNITKSTNVNVSTNNISKNIIKGEKSSFDFFNNFRFNSILMYIVEIWSGNVFFNNIFDIIREF